MIEVIQGSTLLAGESKKQLFTDVVSVGGQNVDFQGIKLMLGAAGANDGPVSTANPLPVGADIKVKYSATTVPMTDGSTRSLAGSLSGALLVAIDSQFGGNDTNNGVTANKPRAVHSANYQAGIYTPPDAGSLADVIKNTSGSVNSGTVLNFNTTKGFWLQVHSAPAAPTSTTSRIQSFWVDQATDAGHPGRREITPDMLSGVLYGTLGISYYASVTPQAMAQTGLVAADCKASFFYA